MKNKKEITSQKESFDNKKSNKIFYYLIGAIVIISIVVIISTIKQTPVNEDSDGEKVKTSSLYEFKKEGELSFNSNDGKYLAAIDIEFAENDFKRMQGLMYRNKMEENQGMLFIFPVEEPQSFWMKNTVLSLDIMFVNSKFEIVKIHKNTTPYSEESLPSNAPSVYVVEVNAGYSDRHNIKEGDRIVWRRI